MDDTKAAVWTPAVIAAENERSKAAILKALEEMGPEPCECCEHEDWLDWVGKLNELAMQKMQRRH